MRLKFLLPILTVLPWGTHAQQPAFKELTDSCFRYLSAVDTVNFNRLYPAIADAYEQYADPETYALRQQLLTMRNSDQGIRLLLLEACKRYGGDSPEAQAVHRKMKQIDRINAVHIQQILHKNGWPTKEDIGEEAYETVFLCIQHVDDLIVQEKYLPMLKQAVEQGNAEGWHLAFLTDRIRMNRGEKQIYGTQTISKPSGELDYVVPLEDPDRVDSLRRSVGLESLASYLDGNWDLEAYKRNLPQTERKFNAFVASRKAAAN